VTVQNKKGFVQSADLLGGFGADVLGGFGAEVFGAFGAAW